jgi:hypothetical protein
MGVPQINEFDIQLDTHRKTRGLPLASYDPSIDFSADLRLQCHLSEKDLLAWAEHHIGTSVDTIQYTYLDVEYFDGFTPDELLQLRLVSERYQSVYDATKGGLPALPNHPPVALNFKPGWKHVSVPVPRWGPGAIYKVGTGNAGQRFIRQVEITIRLPPSHSQKNPNQRPQRR